MKTTITRLFDNYADAAKVVDALTRFGISEDDVSLVANGDSYADGRSLPVDGSPSGAGAGASFGGVVGAGAGLLAGLGAMAIPGLGPVVAAGWLAATATGLAAGAVAGGLIGALVDAGVPETDAHIYADAIRRGGTLLTVRTDQPAPAEDIIDAYASVNIDDRRANFTRTATGASESGRSTYSTPPI